MHIGEAPYFVIGGAFSSSLKFVLLLHRLRLRDHPNVAHVAQGASLLLHPESGLLLRMVRLKLSFLRIHASFICRIHHHHHVRAVVYFDIT